MRRFLTGAFPGCALEPEVRAISPIAEHLERLFEILRPTRAFDSVLDSVQIHPVVLGAIDAHAFEASVLQRRFIEVDLEPPAWVVERADFDTPRVFPVIVAVAQVPALQPGDHAHWRG